VIHDALAVLSGLFVGVASGVLGVGGGIFLVPIMTIGFGIKQHVAQGTSLAAIIPTSVIGAITHDRRGNLDRRVAAWMGAGAAVGAVLGALIAVHAPRQWLARAFGLVLLFAAFRMWPRREQTGKPA
jgi:hypothetical protein